MAALDLDGGYVLLTPFTFHRPSGLDEATGLLAEAGLHSKVISGGQSLLLALKERQVRPARLVSLSAVPDLRGWSLTAEGALEIGAATSYRELAGACLAGWHGELAKVAGNLADRSVRALGTIGGAVCQADPRYDMPTLLVAMEATFTLVSAEITRVVPADEFFRPEGGTQLRTQEILTRISLPPLARFSDVAFDKYRHRVFDAALVTAVCALRLDAGGTVESARLVVGAVGKAPSLATACATVLVGKQLGKLDVPVLAREISEEVLPPSTATTRHRQYQAELVISLMSRTLMRFIDRKDT